MKAEATIVLIMLTTFLFFYGCREETPTTPDLPSITIQVRYDPWTGCCSGDDDNEYYYFHLHEGDYFFQDPFETEEFYLFRVVEIIDPLHAEIWFACPFIGVTQYPSDSCTVFVGMVEEYFGPTTCTPEGCEAYYMRISIGGY